LPTKTEKGISTVTPPKVKVGETEREKKKTLKSFNKLY